MNDGSDPRGHLVDAVVQVAGTAGTSAATVDGIVKAAGASKATFYSHFANRHEAFAAAFEVVAQELARQLRSELARCSRDDPLATLEAGLRGALEIADAQPQATRVLLLEGLAAGPAMRAAFLAELRQAEDAIEELLIRAEEAGTTIQLPPTELLGGLIGPMTTRMYLGGERPASLADDLMTWIGSYRAASGTRRLQAADWERLGSALHPPLPEMVPGRWPRLPRGRAARDAATTRAMHRDRVVRTTAFVARSKGYHAMTVAEVVASANVSRGVFYEHFKSKDDAFFAAQTTALEESIGAAAAAFAAPARWPVRSWRGIEALFTYFASNPDLAILQYLEAHAAGGPALQRVFESRRPFEMFLEEGYRQREEAEALPRFCSEAIGGAFAAVMQRVALEARVGHIVKLVPRATFVATAPFLGAHEALALVTSLGGARPGLVDE